VGANESIPLPTTPPSENACKPCVDDYLTRISGAGIPAETTFTYGGSSAGVLSQAASATATGISVHIQRSVGVGPWLTSGDTPAGVALYAADATNGEIMCSVIARDTEVNLKLLVFPGFDGDPFTAAVTDVISETLPALALSAATRPRRSAGTARTG
jgi:hypothetical protein